MTLDDAFEVDAPVDAVWALLADVPRVAPCIPNATPVEQLDATTYRGGVTVRVGPVSVSYRATIHVEERDDAAKRATLRIEGDDVKGRGGVKATVVSTAAARPGGGTRVALHTEAKISGVVATVGGRLIETVAKRTVAEFAANLARLLEPEAGARGS